MEETAAVALERLTRMQRDPNAYQRTETYRRAADHTLAELTGPQVLGTVFQLVQMSAEKEADSADQGDVFLFDSWKASKAFTLAYLNELYEGEPSELKAHPYDWYELTLCHPDKGGRFCPGPDTYLLSAEEENRDGCCLQVLYILPNGWVSVGAFKHGHCSGL